MTNISSNEENKITFIHSKKNVLHFLLFMALLPQIFKLFWNSF